MAIPSRTESQQEYLPPQPSNSPLPPQAPSKETYPATEPTKLATGENPKALSDVEDQVPATPSIPTAITYRLYISHFLSTWNSRSFEFGSVLVLASIFPLTLLPMSIYALVRSASAIVLAPLIGRAIDRRNRLQVVRLSIGKSPILCRVFPARCMENRRNAADFSSCCGEQLLGELQS